MHKAQALSELKGQSVALRVGDLVSTPGGADAVIVGLNTA